MTEPQRKTYEANCHCGNIKYTVTLPDALAPEGSGKINNCNCSICTKNGRLEQLKPLEFQHDGSFHLTVALWQRRFVALS